jgi:TPR repeat protein
MHQMTLPLVLLLLAAAPVLAGPREDAEAAYNRGDYMTAVRLLRAPAEAGNPAAQHDLGFMYDKGLGVQQDYAKAAVWYRRAAEKGEPLAQNNLGILYAVGKGVPQDYVLAYMWLNLAAARGNSDAAKNRAFVAANMTPTQLAEAQSLARMWKSM